LSFETKSVKSKQFSDTSNFFSRPRGLRKFSEASYWRHCERKRLQ